jgi:hypothetical protein
MSEYIITYIGGRRPATEEEGMQHMAKYRAWLAGLGDSAVSPANPLGKTHTVNSDGSVEEGSKTSMSGYTIIEADSIEDAIAVAKECPFLEVEGTLEVSERMQMPG